MMHSTAWFTPCLIVPPRCAQSTAWHCAVRSHDTIVVLGEWSTRPALHYSCTVASCLHVLQALTTLPACTSCRRRMALTSGVLETYVRALGTCGPSCTVRPASLFFMLVTHSPQETIGHVAARSPPGREAGSGATGHVAHRSPPSGSGATVHVVAPEPFSSGKRVLEPRDTWQPRSPPWLGGRV
jgi:hypothetical protein